PSVRSARLRQLVETGGVIAVAIMVMNVATYGFQMVAARLLGPEQYSAVASMLALLMVVAVLQLGLQATAARRIAGSPGHVAQIEHGIMQVTYRAAAGVGVLMLVAAPLTWKALSLDSWVPAVECALAAIPLTIAGGQAGILQGERRWKPLGMFYLASGVPRVALGLAAMLIRPTEGAAMFAVLVSMWAPVLVGWWVLRRPRATGDLSEDHGLASIARESMHGSMALMSFLVLSNADIMVARNVLTERDAGLYAGGLILTKAVLFAPQFVVVVAFPAMSSSTVQRLRALVASLAAIAVIGTVTILGSWLLSDIAMIFVGGSEYADVESRLWRFALLGTILATLQLLIYSVLARQHRGATLVMWAGAVALIVLGLQADSLDQMITTVTSIDAIVLAALMTVTVRDLRRTVTAEPVSVRAD
ncbi:MAG: lipopolysaccharide biosynthesis protein, partial [Nocardioides sp.]